MDTLEGDIWYLLGPSQVSTKRERIATLAREMPDKALTALCRYLDEDWLLTACARTRKDGAVGIDQETWPDFKENILERLTSLRDRAHSGCYFAPPRASDLHSERNGPRNPPDRNPDVRGQGASKGCGDAPGADLRRNVS